MKKPACRRTCGLTLYRHRANSVKGGLRAVVDRAWIINDNRSCPRYCAIRGAERRQNVAPGRQGLLPNPASLLVSDPLPSAAVSLTRGTLKPAESKTLISPS